jgi:RNA recognition motif-containing protein
MSVKLFVGNLPFRATEDSLRDHFAQVGNVVSASIIIDRMTGRSRGFGFVEVDTDEDAQRAIDSLNEKDFEGRPLVVNVARPPVARDRR